MSVLDNIRAYPSLLRLQSYGEKRHIVSTIPDKTGFLDDEALEAIEEILAELQERPGCIVRVMTRTYRDDEGNRLCECVDAIEFHL